MINPNPPPTKLPIIAPYFAEADNSCAFYFKILHFRDRADSISGDDSLSYFSSTKL